MTLREFLILFLNANIILSLGYLLLQSFSTFLKWKNISISNFLRLKLNYFTIFICFISVLLAPLFPALEFSNKASGGSAEWFQKKPLFTGESSLKVKRDPTFSNSKSTAPPLSSEKELPEQIKELSWGEMIFIFLAFFWTLGLLNLMRDIFQLFKFRGKLWRIKKIGRVTISTSSEISTPMAFGWGLQANIVLPTEFLRNSWFRLSLSHEIQHLRQKDSLWVYMGSALKNFFFCNPIFHRWAAAIEEIQEFCCDEVTLKKNKVTAGDYSRFLVEMSQVNFSQFDKFLLATRFISSSQQQNLKRRIISMMETKTNPWSLRRVQFLMLGLLVGLGTSAFAVQGWLKPGEVSLVQAKSWAEKMKNSSEFPIVVNEIVVQEMNELLSTPEKRRKLKLALARMENLKPLVQAKLKEYQLPQELAVIPLIESGYENLEPIRNPVGAAGLWQFIAPTAHNFGLRVDFENEIDERLDIALETDAAMRYLFANKLRFKNWALSIISYNAGEKAVQKVMDQLKSRDPWVLIRSGLLGRESSSYLPRLIAAILITQNQDQLIN